MILYVHTFYTLKGGEDLVFSQESELLKDVLPVTELTFQNRTGIKGAIQFFSSIWNLTEGRKLKTAIEKYNPTVIHIHNFHFAIGPIAIRIAKKAGIPVIITLHNYRLICPSGILLQNGQIFTDSLKHSFPWKAVRLGVYRKSVAQTFWLALVIWFHKKIGTWNMVDKFVVLTDFAREKFMQSTLGVSIEKFVVKPNFVEGPLQPDLQPRRKHFLFVGRLSEEKGIALLLEAFKATEFELRIAGDGPMQQEVQLISKNNHNITYLGPLNAEGVKREMLLCSALIFPSIWFEGMPMTILEAFANSTPIIASNLGAMSSLIKDKCNGLHFAPNNPADLKEKIAFWGNLPDTVKSNYYINCFNTYKQFYSPEFNKAYLLNLYSSLQGTHTK